LSSDATIQVADPGSGFADDSKQVVELEPTRGLQNTTSKVTIVARIEAK